MGLRTVGLMHADWLFFELSSGALVMVGIEPNVLVPRSKDAHANLHGTGSYEHAFKNGDFALASKI